MSETNNNIRIFATCDVGREALDLLRERGYRMEVYDQLDRGMAGRCVQSLIDVLEAGGGLAAVPCVVNKEAFR
jgi:hypothetical protein